MAQNRTRNIWSYFSIEREDDAKSAMQSMHYLTDKRSRLSTYNAKQLLILKENLLKF